MKVISIKQPWASLIIYGYKEYEFRSWKTNYRGELFIHASKSYNKKDLELFKDYNIPFDTGCIIGSVNLDECILLDKEKSDVIHNKNPYVYLHPYDSKYAWKVSNPKKTSKIYVNGRLNIWEYEKK
ncbi:MAG: ASCH domain-containing protein [Firmicutes bacterium]|nr:ASCH domain-containing protein [Bacillota bacterium]